MFACHVVSFIAHLCNLSNIKSTKASHVHPARLQGAIELFAGDPGASRNSNARFPAQSFDINRRGRAMKCRAKRRVNRVKTYFSVFSALVRDPDGPSQFAQREDDLVAGQGEIQRTQSQVHQRASGAVKMIDRKGGAERALGFRFQPLRPEASKAVAFGEEVEQPAV